MWKIFVVIAAVALVAAGLLGWQNKDAFERENRLRQAAEKKETDTTARIAATKTELKKTSDELQVVKNAPTKLSAEVTTVELAVSAQEKIEGELSTDLDKIIDKIAAAQDLIDKLGPIEGIVAEMKKLEAEQEAANQDYAGAKNALDLAKQRNANLDTRLGNYAAIGRGQITGEMPRGLRTTVESANNRWGFVVLNAGESQGVVANAQLAVARQGVRICLLTVTTLEPNMSVASIVPGSLPSGYYVVPGDLVVVSPREETAPDADS